MKILKYGLIIIVAILSTACSSKTLNSSEVAIKKCVEDVLLKEDKNVECSFGDTMTKDDDPVLADDEKEYFLYCDMDIERETVKDDIKDQNIVVIENTETGEIKWFNSVGLSSDDADAFGKYEYCDADGKNTDNNQLPNVVCACTVYYNKISDGDNLTIEFYESKSYNMAGIFPCKKCESGTAMQFVKQGYSTSDGCYNK